MSQSNDNLGPTSSSTDTPSKSKDVTAEYLIRLSIAIVNAVNSREYEHAAIATTHIAPNFTADYDNAPAHSSLQEHMDVFRANIAEHPNYHIEVTNPAATVDELAGTAKVFIDVTVTGHYPGVERHAIGILDWRVIGGTWMCFKHTGMRVMGVV